ncbi:hypothetical protein Nepgr_029876 [Nepenthes gracilis]|uniref:Secreted protein n=1 Tax=Nepenthes gracilis TaxID=150966 RepID=A0AAD3Y3M9_NEPGR|nr:hypothetical protein Nepgr_029876 [Nepenthes gracilis]
MVACSSQLGILLWGLMCPILEASALLPELMFGSDRVHDADTSYFAELWFVGCWRGVMMFWSNFGVDRFGASTQKLYVAAVVSLVEASWSWAADFC